MKRLLALLLLLCTLTACAAPPADAVSSATAASSESASQPEDEPAPESSSQESSQPEPKKLLPRERVRISEPELVYGDEDMDFTMDSSFATLRQEDGSIFYWQTCNGSDPRYPMYRGTAEDPLQELETVFEWDYNGLPTHDPLSTVWLMNVYEHTDGTLIGFIHREDLYDNNAEEKANFYIGLAISTDGGYHWKYGGDILGTRMNHKLGRNQPQPNMGGVPYLVVGDYFYLYFNEYTGITRRHIGLARCRIDETVEALKNGTLPKVEKYGDGSFNIEPMEGSGDSVIPGSSSGLHDSHADAAWCEPLGMYLMTVQTHGMGQLQMYLSEDGINWDTYVLLDNVGQGSTMHPYSTFVGLEGSTDDFHTVGSHFYIYFPRKGVSGSAYNSDDLYRVEIQILDETGEPME